jgi:hypothetical protein
LIGGAARRETVDDLPLAQPFRNAEEPLRMIESACGPSMEK